jgi:hypothetical protein
VPGPSGRVPGTPESDGAYRQQPWQTVLPEAAVSVLVYKDESFESFISLRWMSGFDVGVDEHSQRQITEYTKL